MSKRRPDRAPWVSLLSVTRRQPASLPASLMGHLAVEASRDDTEYGRRDSVGHLQWSFLGQVEHHLVRTRTLRAIATPERPHQPT
jgi:hypothetical protein